MSTQKAKPDSKEKKNFDPRLSDVANGKDELVEKPEEVKKEEEKHVEKNVMLTTLAGRNEVLSGRADAGKSKVAKKAEHPDNDEKKEKNPDPLEHNVTEKPEEANEPGEKEEKVEPKEGDVVAEEGKPAKQKSKKSKEGEADA